MTRAGTLDYMSPEVLLCPEKSRPEENKVGRRVLAEVEGLLYGWVVGGAGMADGRGGLRRRKRAGAGAGGWLCG